MTEEEFVSLNPEVEILGYRKGFVYVQLDQDIYRGDEYDYTAFHWYSTKAGFTSNIIAYGPLFDKNGNAIYN